VGSKRIVKMVPKSSGGAMWRSIVPYGHNLAVVRSTGVRLGGDVAVMLVLLGRKTTIASGRGPNKFCRREHA